MCARHFTPVVVAALAAGLAAPCPAFGQVPVGRPSPNICLLGTGSRGWCGDGGPARTAKLAHPRDVAVAPDGALVIADMDNQVIRRVNPDGRIVTLAGTGLRGNAEDRVDAESATFRNPMGVAIDLDGSVLVADTGNQSLRRIGTDGVVRIVRRGLAEPSDVVVLPDGSYVVPEPPRDRVVRVSRDDGSVSLLAGSGALGFSG